MPWDSMFLRVLTFLYSPLSSKGIHFCLPLMWIEDCEYAKFGTHKFNKDWFKSVYNICVCVKRGE